MKLTPDEAFVEKRFKKDGFKVLRINAASKYKAPDFLLTKLHPIALCEVKLGFRKGKIMETLSTGAQQIDPEYAVYELFEEASIQYQEYLLNNPKYNKLPFILTFKAPFFIDKDLEWSDSPYKKYPTISAIFIPKDTHPLDSMAWDIPLEELEKIIETQRFRSQVEHKWYVIKNPYATNPLNLANFSSIAVLQHPLKSQN